MNKKLWELYPDIWKTESAFMSWIRGGIRRSLWKNHPVKIEFIKKNRIQIPNSSPRAKKATVWGGVCALTGQALPLAQLEVDHKTGEHSLRSLNDLQKFIEGIVLISLEDLQFVSKEAHRIKSYADKHRISFEEAMAIKEAIRICKEGTDRQWLEERGIVAASTKIKRRQQIEQHLKGNL